VFLPSLDTIKRRLGFHSHGNEIVTAHRVILAFYHLPLAAKELLTKAESVRLADEFYLAVSTIDGDEDLIVETAERTLKTHWINVLVYQPKRGRGKVSL